MYTTTKWSRTKNDKYSHFYLECVVYAALYNDGHFWRSPGDHVSPSSGSSVKYRRSLQQNTVRDATHHGNTLQRRRQSGEGGVMCFSSSKATTLKVNFNLNSKESNREWQNLQLRRLWSENTGGGFHRDKNSASRRFHRPLRLGSMACHTTCFMRTHFMTTVLCSTMADFLSPYRHQVGSVGQPQPSLPESKNTPLSFRRQNGLVIIA